ncbi:hypothetical protein [Nonomuraea sp. SYSU D8015]|uniref:hypothetical protein n=1 Tax=Nonomuraea sp. SYSU D8015 TaxID=2593644 RepID=UPI0016613520|nr:hypothetical protein [Nonomuraea sp. SYSU D8015]
MATTTISASTLDALNGRHHKTALTIYLFIVVAHWAEHVAQAAQVYVWGWPLPEARGVLGMPFPWLVTSEWMHYGYALLMLVGLIMLRKGFTGSSRTWWNISLGIQVWHHLEHLLLLVQKLSGVYLAGRPVPTSLLQLAFPRMELHLFYNAVVFAPMVVAMLLHRRPSERHGASCTCAIAH